MLGLQSSKSLKHAKKQQNLDFFRIFAEFSRKFARMVHEEPHRLGLRFFFYTIAKVFRRFQVARDSFSLLKPRKLRSRLSKFRIFALIVFVSFPEFSIKSCVAKRMGAFMETLEVSFLCLRQVRIEVELLLQNRPPLSL